MHKVLSAHVFQGMHEFSCVNFTCLVRFTQPKNNLSEFHLFVQVVCRGTEKSFCGINCPVLLVKHVVLFENNVVNSYGKIKKLKNMLTCCSQNLKNYRPMQRRHKCVRTSSTVLNGHRTCL